MTESNRFRGNHTETAQLLGISEQALWKAVTERGCPAEEKVGRERMYFWPAVIAWRMKDVVPNDLSVERARLAKEQADRQSMDNDLRRGITANVEDVELEWADLIVACRAKLLAMPRKLAPQLTNVADPNAIEERLTEELHAALEELAGDGESEGGAPQRPREVQAAAEAHRQ